MRALVILMRLPRTQKLPRDVPQTRHTVAPKLDDDHPADRASRQQAAQPAPGVLLDELKRLRGEPSPRIRRRKEIQLRRHPRPRHGRATQTLRNPAGVLLPWKRKSRGKAKTGVCADKSFVAGAMQKERDAEQNTVPIRDKPAARQPVRCVFAVFASSSAPASSSQQVTFTAQLPKVPTKPLRFRR